MAIVVGVVVAAIVTAAFLISGDDEPSGGAAQITVVDDVAKAEARTGQTAIERWAIDHKGNFGSATVDDLMTLEPNVPADLDIVADRSTYTVTVTSESGNTFSLSNDGSGGYANTCTEAGTGGCEANGQW